MTAPGNGGEMLSLMAAAIDDHMSFSQSYTALELATVAVGIMRSHTLIYRDDGDVVHEMRGAPDDIWKTLLDAILSPAADPTTAATSSRGGQHDAPAALGEG